MRQDITEHVFPFMEEHGLTELILDNASCQDGLAQWIRDEGYSTPGFASLRRNHHGGYPPNSSDCMANDATVFARAKVLMAERDPKTVPQAISALKAVFRSLQDARCSSVDVLPPGDLADRVAARAQLFERKLLELLQASKAPSLL